MLLQVIINGLMLALTYVLIASGFNIAVGVCRIMNFAHGELYMLGAIGIYYFYEILGINYVIAGIIAMVLVALLGMLVERVLFRPLREMYLPNLITACCVMFFIAGMALLLFGETGQGVHSVVTGMITILGAKISLERLLIIVSSVIIIVALHLLVQRTRLGRAMRAVAQDSTAAALQGISINYISAISMGLASALAAAAGVLLAPVFVVTSFMGMNALLKAFIVVVIGGLGSMPGAIAGGLLLGFFEAFGATYLGGITEALVYAVVILVIMIRPTGLLGRPWSWEKEL